jgi:tRNA-dihydrouridine synthase A
MRSFSFFLRFLLLPHHLPQIPPLKHAFAGRLAADFPSLRFSLNGGLETLEDCQHHLQSHLNSAPLPNDSSASTSSSSSSSGASDEVSSTGSAARMGPLHGVMLGRAAVARPWHLLASVDELLYHEPPPVDGAYRTRRQIIEEYTVYAEEQLAICQVVQPAYARKLCRQLVRPVANLFAGEPGGAKFRQALDHGLQADAFAKSGAPGAVRAVLEPACAGLKPHVLDAPPPHVLTGTSDRDKAAKPLFDVGS